MRQQAIVVEKHKILAAAVVAIGLAFSYGQARAEDSVQTRNSTPSAAVQATPIVVKGTSAGGLRRGDTMLLTPWGAERVKPDQLASQQPGTHSGTTTPDACNRF